MFKFNNKYWIIIIINMILNNRIMIIYLKEDLQMNKDLYR